MRKLSLAVLLLAAAASADVVIENAGVSIGPVKALNCQADAGVLCSRSTGSVGTLRCNGATATEAGCVTPSAQTYAGDKTILGFLRLVGVAHASLTACDVGHKNMAQGCTTHGALVWCDGTTNIEFTGGSSTEKDLASAYVNGVPQTLMGSSFTCQSACTVTAIEGTWGAGSTSDGGTLVFRLTDGSNNCDCTEPCASPTTRTPCSGSCSFAAGVTVTPKRQSTTCTMNPYVGGNLQVKGTTP